MACVSACFIFQCRCNAFFYLSFYQHLFIFGYAGNSCEFDINLLFIYVFIYLFICAEGTRFPRAENIKKEMKQVCVFIYSF